MNGSAADRRGITDLLDSTLLKKRYLFGISRDEYEEMGHRENGVRTRVIDDLDLGSPDIQKLLRTDHHWNDPMRWARDGVVDVLVAFDEEDVPIGYYMTLVPEEETVWHDELPVTPGSALVFKGFVSSEHRRKGVYKALQRAAHDHLFFVREVDQVLTIVESSNFASLNANNGFGLRTMKCNYLLKFLNRNAMSIYRSEDGLEMYWVWDKEKLRTI